MPYSLQKATEIKKLVDDIGIDATAERTGLKRESVRRVIRIARSKARETMAAPIEQTDTLIKKLYERFSHDELSAIANGKSINPARLSRPVIDFKGDDVVISFITDTHIGEEAFEDSLWISFLAECKREGVQMILHAGDVHEGMSNRPDQVYHLEDMGASAQMAHAERLFKMTDLPIKVIDGNHDRWGVKSNGLFMVPDLCKRVPNMEFIGSDTGDVIINGSKWRLWHGEDGSCFDDQTEIQTKTGWKKFSELTKNDYVATMTKDTHEFQWQKPTDIFVKEYNGDMIHFNSRTVDCMVTPNHGMWTRVSECATYRRKDILSMPTKSHIRLNTEWHRKNAGDIYNEYSRQKWQFTKICDSWEGTTPEYVTVPYRKSKNTGKKVYHFGNVPIEDMAELIAWYVTEGHAGKNYTTISQYSTVNPENHAQIVELAKRLGANYGVGKKSITIHSVELAEYLKQTCGHMSRHKYLPEWLKECDTSILNLVLDTMIAGDGWNVASKNAYGYRSISPRLVNDFAEIAIKCGYAVNFGSNGESVGIYKKQATPTVNALPKVLHYEGTIYCCEVPNGLINVRRNGKTLWTHNSYATSYRVQKIIESFTGGDKPNVLLCGHTHKQISMFERNIHAVSGGALSYQSSWMRSTRKPCHTGFHIIHARIKDGGIVRFAPIWYPFYE